MNTYFSRLKPSLYVVPKNVYDVTPAEKLLKITKPWLFLKVFEGEDFSSRLPEHYKYFYWSWKHGDKGPVHYVPQKGNFKLAENKEFAVAVKNEPVQVVYPTNCDEGLWGGEGIIKGYKHMGRYKGEVAKYWFPTLELTTLYSEILDCYFETTVTPRALELIDNHYGLDYYLLETSPADVYSALGMRLKREMLLVLVNQTLYPDDPVTRKEITEKYKRFIIPIEEAEWVGLSLEEACLKQKETEELQLLKTTVPFKHQFRNQLLEYLKENPPSTDGGNTLPSVPDVADQLLEAKSKKKSWLKSLNPFGR